VRPNRGNLSSLPKRSKINRGTLVTVQQQADVEPSAVKFWRAVETVLDAGPIIRDAKMGGDWNATVADTVNVGVTTRLNLINCAALATDLATVTQVVATDVTATGTIEGTDVNVADGGLLRLYEDQVNGVNFVAFKALATLVASTTWTLPSADGTVGQVLKTDGSGVLGWVSAVTDHGGLSGLADDDHPQYALDSDLSGYQPLDADLTSWAGVTRAAGFDTFAATALGATTTVLVGGGVGSAPVWTTATGTGAPVRATSPALVTPDIGAATGTSLSLTGGIGVASTQRIWFGGLNVDPSIRANASSGLVLRTNAVDRLTITSAGAATFAQTLAVTGTTTLAGLDATSIGATTPGTGAFTTLERKQGSASDTVKVGGRVYVNTASAATSLSTYTDLMSHALAASTLITAGDSVHVKMAFRNTTTGGNTAGWKVLIDGDLVYESTATATDGYDTFEMDVYYLTSTSAEVYYKAFLGGLGLTQNGYVGVTPSAWSSAITIKAQGKDSGAAGELLQELMDITWLPNNT